MGSSSEGAPRFEVVVTRDEERARPLATRLAAHGLRVVALPLTRTAPATPEEWATMVALGRAAVRFDWVVAPSANAAEALVRAVADGQGRLAGRVLAVGPATRAALAAHGIAAVTPARADAIGAAEHLIAEGATAVWWPHAEAGRDEGIELLRARGVAVEAPVAYRTVAVGRGDPAIAGGLAALPGAAVVCFYAPSHVAALADLVDLAVLAARKVVAIGETTAAALAARGVRVDAVPASPEPDAMASAIVAVYPGRT
jgi:uroporphyrinogen-III synthase